MARPLNKCISLAGAIHHFSTGHTHQNDYKKWDSSNPPREPNRDYVRSSGTSYIRVWTDWSAMQPNGSGSFQQTCDQMNHTTFGRDAFQALDRQIQAANQDGVRVILVTTGFPPWTNGTTRNNEVPIDRSTTGPWAWWITYLFLRYTGAHNALGPGSNNSWQGNPYSARIEMLEIVNEPNQTYTVSGKTAQHDYAGMACVISDMIRTADSMANWWMAQGYRVPIFGAPATSDVLQFEPIRFADNVLSNLSSSGWRGAAPWRWTHHNYQDIKNDTTVRLTDTRTILGRWPWSGQNRNIWLTEGGWDNNVFALSHPPEGDQNFYCRRNYERVRNIPDVFMWTNHMVNEEINHIWETGLFNEWNGGNAPGGTQGTIRTWGNTWRGIDPNGV